MTEMNHGETIEAEAADWVARRDTAEHWTSQLEGELQSWIARSPAHHISWLRLSTAWRRMDRIADAPMLRAAHPSPAGVSAQPAPANAAGDAPAAVMAPRFDPRTKRGTHRRALAGWALAAGIILGVGFATFPRFHLKGGESLETRMGAREEVTLSDGSRVTLNTSTRGRAIVNEKERRFWLEEGEVYFEIAHDSTRPFVVQAGRDRVTVLGTKFSVRHEHGRSEITVIEGRVQLDSDGGGPASKPVVMTRNESAVATAGNVLVIAKNEQAVRDELSWRVGRLVFDQMTLADVAARFNRYNGTQLVITGAAAERRFSGSFDATNVEGFARLLHESFGLEVHRDGKSTLVVADRP